jgi:hypothetical protein
MVPTFRDDFLLSAIGVVEKQRLKLTRTLQTMQRFAKRVSVA